jgi:hypothetical protein
MVFAISDGAVAIRLPLIITYDAMEILEAQKLIKPTPLQIQRSNNDKKIKTLRITMYLYFSHTL